MTALPPPPVYKTERQPVLRVRNSVSVASRSTWPVAASSTMFVWEAIDQIGKAKFGSEWTGRELQAQYWALSPARALHLARAQRLTDISMKILFPSGKVASVASYRKLSEMNKNKAVQHDAHVLHWRTRTAADLETEAAEAEDRLWRENANSLLRLNEVVSWFGQRCRDGEIKCFTRLVAGGSLTPMPAADWNAEPTLTARIAYGGWSRAAGVGKTDVSARIAAIHSKPEPELLYIFVDRPSLTAAIAPFDHANMTVSERDISFLPEPLKIAIAIATAHPGIGKEGAKARELKARAEWNRRFPGAESEKYIDAISTVLGLPDLEKIIKQKALRKTSPPT